MRRRFLAFFAFLASILLTVYISKEISLYYYIMSTICVFPVYYFLKERAWIFFTLSGLIWVGLHSFFFYKQPAIRILILFFLQSGIASALLLYHWELKKLQFRVLDSEAIVQKKLNDFQAKYQVRMQSLRHLEEQVSSLVNLFEIARDFSECMDFLTLSEFLLKKIRVNLQFKEMQIILYPSEFDASAKQAKFYIMENDGVSIETRVLSEEETEQFSSLKESNSQIKKNDSYCFPIKDNGSIVASFSIRGIAEEDFAQVEVLCAYLVLLIKKIRLYETVRELAIIDELTQVWTRRHFLERFEEELRRSLRFKRPLAVLMLDIDHFKRYNDDFGHIAGDATIKEVAHLLKQSLRKMDLVGRYGGEEFVVIMPETKIDDASEVSERIRSTIARHSFSFYNVKTKVTVSQGIAIFDDFMIQESEQQFKKITAELIRKADVSMYRAKEEGRNRVCVYKE